MVTKPAVSNKVGRVVPSAPWPMRPLGEIAEVKLGKMLDKKRTGGRMMPYLRNINVRWGFVDTEDLLEMPFEEDELERYDLKQGDVLVCEGGEPGRAAVWHAQVSNLKFQKAIHRVRFKEKFESRLLVYYLELLAKTGTLERRFTGSTIKHFTREVILQLPVPVPPIAEQRRIVAEIEKQFTRLDTGVAALRRTQANLKRYRAAVLKAACEGRLVPTEAELANPQPPRRGSILRESATLGFESGAKLLERILGERRKMWSGRGKYKEPIAPEPHAGLELPDGWTWTGFDQIADGTKHAIKAGPFGSSLKKSFYTPNGFKIYGQEQVIKGDAHFGDYFISRELFEQLRGCEVKSGDILVSLVGTTGKVLILPDDCAPGIINPRLLKLSLSRTGVNPKFIKILLESTTTRAFFKLAAHGGTMEILNLGILKTLPIALPPLSEQTRIVAEVERRMSLVEELETAVNANIQRAIRLRQSILKSAFSNSTT